MPDMNVLLPYLLSAALGFIASKLGIKLPNIMPTPNPTPVTPEVDKPLKDCLTYLLEVKAGLKKLDELDKQTLVTLAPLVAELSK